MFQRDRIFGYGRTSIFSSWMIFVLVGGQVYVASTMSRTPAGSSERALLTDLHMNIGALILLFVLIRLMMLVVSPRPAAPQGLPEAAFGFQRMITVTLFLTLMVMAGVGFFNAWGYGHEIHLFGGVLTVPALVELGDYAVRTRAGYFHSALGFFQLGLIALLVLVGLYHAVRYRVGVARLFPGKSI